MAATTDGSDDDFDIVYENDADALEAGVYAAMDTWPVALLAVQEKGRGGQDLLDDLIEEIMDLFERENTKVHFDELNDVLKLSLENDFGLVVDDSTIRMMSKLLLSIEADAKKSHYTRIVALDKKARKAKAKKDGNKVRVTAAVENPDYASDSDDGDAEALQALIKARASTGAVHDDEDDDEGDEVGSNGGGDEDNVEDNNANRSRGNDEGDQATGGGPSAAGVQAAPEDDGWTTVTKKKGKR